MHGKSAIEQNFYQPSRYITRCAGDHYWRFFVDFFHFFFVFKKLSLKASASPLCSFGYLCGLIFSL
jgi:hypothetical protein